jgi:acyl transferase domain-containing protein/acyl carrier protein
MSDMKKLRQRELLEESCQQLTRLRHALEQTLHRRDEPIAIVGIGCRFPGGGSDPQAFWYNLINAVDGISEFPEDRWDTRRYCSTEAVAGKTYAKHGGFVDSIDEFDPLFFGISPREAVGMDPQQRILLEVCWNALEDAAISPEDLRGSRSGVFVGVSSDDYAQRAVNTGDLAHIDAFLSLGTARSVIAGRVAYCLGLQGPALQIDTSCSSSLMSVHLACESLRRGESNLALAGGVNLLLAPESWVGLASMNALSVSGRCRTFDAMADGYVRGEGCGVVVLKRLSDALADGDRIVAQICGSAVNHDGRSNGMTAPNGQAQVAVIRQALKNAKVQANQVQYVEAHGTGTKLGDPIEVDALGQALELHRRRLEPLLLGSVKSNIGHLEAAAGAAALIKVALCLHQKRLPPNLNYSSPNPYIPWDKYAVKVVEKAMDWPATDKRVAGVSAFGLSGTNVHMILEQAPEVTDSTNATVGLQSRPQHILALSARNAPALEALVARYAAYLETQTAQSLIDVCHTANVGRSHFEHRLSVVTESLEDLSSKLTAHHAGERPVGVYAGVLEANGKPKVAFLFTGQGSQYMHMGRALYESQPVFRAALERCAALLREELDQPLLAVLYPAEGERSVLDETRYTQPALFALEYALSELWRSWGIVPDVVMGHSVGEYVAACVAGVFSLADGLKLVAARGRLMQSLPPGGGMAAIMASESVVSEQIVGYAGELSIAAINGPRQTVIAGRLNALEAVLAACEGLGIETRRLPVSHAFHSPLMEPILDEFTEIAEQVTYRPATLALVSNVSGELIAHDQLLNAQYWREHIVSPVRFATSIVSLEKHACEVFLEIGPKQVLQGMARQCLGDGEYRWLTSLRSDSGDWQTLLQSLGELYTANISIDWRAVDAGHSCRKIVLPTYPFQRQRYWLEVGSGARRGISVVRDGTLSCRRLLSSAFGDQAVFEYRINTDNQTYLADHRLGGSIVFPASAFIKLAIEAGIRLFGTERLIISNFKFTKILELKPGLDYLLQVIFVHTGMQPTFRILSLMQQEDGGDLPLPAVWIEHALGKLTANELATPAAPLAQWHDECREKVAVAPMYSIYARYGLEYGPAFQAVRTIKRCPGKVLGELRLPEPYNIDTASTHLHPVLMDAFFQLLGAALDREGLNQAYKPVGIKQLHIYSQGGEVLHGYIHSRGEPHRGLLYADGYLTDARGQLVAELRGLCLRAADLQPNSASFATPDPHELYELGWRPRPLAQNGDAQGRWLIFADRQGHGARIAMALRAKGGDCTLVYAQDTSMVIPGIRSSVLDPEDSQAYAKLLSRDADQAAAYRGVLYLWGLDLESPEAAMEEGEGGSQLLGCGALLYLVKALVNEASSQSTRLWLLSDRAQPIIDSSSVRNFQQSTLWGLGRVVAVEHPQLGCTCLDFDLEQGPDYTDAVVTELTASDAENQVGWRRGKRYVARLAPDPSPETLPADECAAYTVVTQAVGDFDKLTTVAIERRPPASHEVEIEIHATGLNFKDILYALGVLTWPASTGNAIFGLECAGVVTAVGDAIQNLKVGDPVVSSVQGCLASHTIVAAEYVLKKPPASSFAEAAALPTAFLTAYYALYDLGNLQAGERVLIHAGAGGVGQAAIQLAQLRGAHVYATASRAKWDHLRRQGVTYIMDSRSLDYADEIMALTNGEGVDVVLNSLSGEYIDKNLQILAPGGRFIEIGKRAIWSAAEVAKVRPDVKYHCFDLSETNDAEKGRYGDVLGAVFHWLEAGNLKPLPVKVFPMTDLVGAFRYLSSAKNIGKVVIERSITEADDYRPADRGLQAKPDATYLITGGLGALGFASAQELVAQGARHLVLIGRQSPSVSLAEQLTELEAKGVALLVARVDVTRFDELAALFEQIDATMPPLAGVIHAAGVLDDGVLSQLDWLRFGRVMAPKVKGAWNLHRLTEKRELDIFISFSSISALIGAPGQGSYAAANAYLDTLMHYRRNRGLPGLSINWGPWADTGMAANGGVQSRAQGHGIYALPTQHAFALLGQLLAAGRVQALAARVDWQRLSSHYPFIPSMLRDLIDAPVQPNTQPRPELMLRLQQAPVGQRRDLLMTELKRQLAAMLDLPPEVNINARQRLFELGLDSLLALELKNKIELGIGVKLPSTLLFDYPTLEAIVDHLMAELLPSDDAEKTAQGIGATSDGEVTEGQELDELSDDDLESLLAKELGLQLGKRM